MKKRRKIIALITLLFTLASAILSFFVIKPKYEANTKLFIGKESTGTNESYSQSDVIMYQTLMKTYCEVIKTKEFVKLSKELFPNGNIKILQQVSLPEKPVSPNKIINIAIAFLLGLMVSIGLSFLLEFLDKTIRAKEQLEGTK